MVPDRDQVPQREAVAAQRGQPGPARSGEVLRRPRVVRRRRAARRGDHRLHPADRVGEVEVHSVQGLDRLVHHRLQPLADRLHAVHGRTVHVQPAHGLHRGPAGNHLLGLGALLGQDPPVLGPAPRVGVLEAAARPEVRAGPPPGGDGVPLPADGVRRPLGARGVLVAEVVADRRHGTVGGGRRPGQLGAQRLGPGRDERRRSTARSATRPAARRRCAPASGRRTACAGRPPPARHGTRRRPREPGPAAAR